MIATLVQRARARHRATWIMSTDRDYYQLLSSHVRVLNTAMHPGKRHLGPDEVHARYGVAPQQWPCFCALKGDSGDNIPGVLGVGATTAARFLAGGLSLDELHAFGRLTGVQGRRVEQQWDQVLTWRKLVRMRTDLPLPLAPTGDPSPDLPKPAEMIEKLELW